MQLSIFLDSSVYPILLDKRTEDFLLLFPEHHIAPAEVQQKAKRTILRTAQLEHQSLPVLASSPRPARLDLKFHSVWTGRKQVEHGSSCDVALQTLMPRPCKCRRCCGWPSERTGRGSSTTPSDLLEQSPRPRLRPPALARTRVRAVDAPKDADADPERHALVVLFATPSA
jgi:hypothetical protein